MTGYYLWVGTSPGTDNLVGIGPLRRHQRDGESAHQRSSDLRAGANSFQQRHRRILRQLHVHGRQCHCGRDHQPDAWQHATGASTTFTWSAGTGGVTADTILGGYIAGAADLANLFGGTSTSATVTLPTSGATIYVQLETHLGGTILENNNTYTEAP